MGYKKEKTQLEKSSKEQNYLVNVKPFKFVKPGETKTSEKTMKVKKAPIKKAKKISNKVLISPDVDKLFKRSA